MITVTFLKFPKSKRWYAMTQMGRAHSWLSEVEGCKFYKLMGSGAGKGFSIFPDLSTYCLLMKWEAESDAERFLERHDDFQVYRDEAEQGFTLFLKAKKAHGSWDGQQPFEFTTEEIGDRNLVVLTRATIKKRFIPYFWSQVPKASADVQTTPGHIFSKGVGEVPLLHQATVSVWKNYESMRSYAYQHDSHINMIRKTREKGWYSEELFAEFILVRTVGDIWLTN